MNATVNTEAPPAPLTVADVKAAAMEALVNVGRMVIKAMLQTLHPTGFVGLVLGDDDAHVALYIPSLLLETLEALRIGLTDEQKATLTPEAQAERDAEANCLIVVVFMGEVNLFVGDRLGVTGDRGDYESRMMAKHTPASPAN
jgi:hypothetical protein